MSFIRSKRAALFTPVLLALVPSITSLSPSMSAVLAVWKE